MAGGPAIRRFRDLPVWFLAMHKHSCCNAIKAVLDSGVQDYIPVVSECWRFATDNTGNARMSHDRGQTLMNSYHQNPGLAAIPSSVWGGAFEEIVILVRTAARKIEKAAMGFGMALRNRNAYRQLKALDNRLLADIGFARLPDGNVIQVLRK